MTTKKTDPAAVNAGIGDLRSHILNKSDAPEELVTVDGWEVTVLVRGLTGKQRARFQDAATKTVPGAPANAPKAINWDRFWADLVILTMRDPKTSELVFEQGDRDMLLEKAAANLEAVSSVARRLSGLDDNAMAAAKSEDPDD